MLRGDRVQDARGRARPRHRGAAGRDTRPATGRGRAGPSRLARRRTRAPPRPGCAPGSASRSASCGASWSRTAPRRAGLRPRSRAGRRRGGASRSPPSAVRAVAAAAVRRGTDGGDAVVGRRGRIGRGQRLRDQLLDPAELLERRLRLEAPDRSPVVADERRRARHRARPACPSRRPAIDASRSASGANSRAVSEKSPCAEQVHPGQRVPGVLAKRPCRRSGPPRARR